MYVKRIVEDNWSGARNNGSEYGCNDIMQVVAAIKHLNGRTKTEVHFEADGEKSFSVGGGNDGRYVAFITIGFDDEFYNLVDLRQPKGQDLDVITGGQRGTFAPKQVVDLETVLEAARQFALDGGMAPALTWEKQQE
ncbi:MAG: Imm1 family immunity protein [Gemmataceae bacterium]